MENKGTKYFLFVAMAAVWGILGYQVYKRMNPATEQNPLAEAVRDIRKTAAALDTFSIPLNYPDPFLKGIKQMPTRSTAITANRPKTAVNPVAKPAPSPPKPVIFPVIQYKGTLRLKSGKTVALVAFDGKNVHLLQGEKHQEVELAKIYEDSIKVKFQKVEKTILKFH